MTTQIEQQIIDAIHQICSDLPPGQGDGKWTEELSRRIGVLGQNLGWEVCASRNCDGQFDNGWLYDLTWFRNDEEGHLQEVGLVLESEWGRKPSDIKYDFEKLLVAKAPLKVMIFQEHRSNLPELLGSMEKGIDRFKSKSPHERYILAGFQEEPYAFQVKVV